MKTGQCRVYYSYAKRNWKKKKNIPDGKVKKWYHGYLQT
jgi:hypothetical protein